MQRQAPINNRPEVIGQQNDCTVRALATACGRDYVEVLRLLRAEGRRDGKGFEIYDWIERNEGRVLGCLLTRVRLPGTTGIYIAGRAGHVWCEINGQRFDTSNWFASRKTILVTHCYLVKRNHEAVRLPRVVSAITED